jgi:hypothetical protein
MIPATRRTVSNRSWTTIDHSLRGRGRAVDFATPEQSGPITTGDSPTGASTLRPRDSAGGDWELSNRLT